MKKLLIVSLLMLTTISIMAIPAKKGLWNTLKLVDGTEVRAQLMGDEHMHYWTSEDGRQFIEQDGQYVVADNDIINSRATARRTKASGPRTRLMKKVTLGDHTHYQGTKKGIVILVNFYGTTFQSGNNLAKYKRIMNEEGYSEGNFCGSVRDYFKAQSNGKFTIDFDVVGPYDLKNSQSYYGKNDAYGNDLHPDSMVVEAVKAADAEVNFKDYDWDGDGEVDQVFVLYAGKGEADGGSASTIWPHMWILSDTNADLTLDGVHINTYACSNEIDASRKIEGIGCFCHEFSHCLGYPDLYDTVNKSLWGMGDFDLMCGGSYNGGTFLPAGYSAYEKWMAGWLNLIELSDTDMDINNLKPMSENGDGYIIYNKAHPDEYIIIENRQLTNWDASLPGKGLMITHVDFDKDIWEGNYPNSKVTETNPLVTEYGYPTNDHMRLTIFHADNTASSYNESTDLYPYGKKDSLTNTSVPKASLYNANTDRKKLLNKGITKICQNSDGTMNFHFRATATEQSKPNPGTDPDKNIMFYESFNKCDGKGGNDDSWETTGFAAVFTPDHEDWEYLKAYGGYQCARFGNGSTAGEATTPEIFLGSAETTVNLSFRAAAWNNDDANLSLSIEGDATIIPEDVTMDSFEWNDYTATISGKGSVRLSFKAVKRFILDEVKVYNDVIPTNIKAINESSMKGSHDVYDLQGRKISDTQRHGIYIVNGKKVIR